jgi:hypothetical protein
LTAGGQERPDTRRLIFRLITGGQERPDTRRLIFRLIAGGQERQDPRRLIFSLIAGGQERPDTRRLIFRLIASHQSENSRSEVLHPASRDYVRTSECCDRRNGSAILAVVSSERPVSLLFRVSDLPFSRKSGPSEVNFQLDRWRTRASGPSEVNFQLDRFASI